MDPERDQESRPDTSESLVRQPDEVTVGISSLTSDMEAFARRVADLQAALQERLIEVNQREVGLAGREADLAGREADLAGRESDLAARAADLERQAQELVDSRQQLEAGGSELDAWQKELEQVHTELEARAAQLATGEAKLAAREEAVLKFQSTMMGVMQALNSPGMNNVSPALNDMAAGDRQLSETTSAQPPAAPELSDIAHTSAPDSPLQDEGTAEQVATSSEPPAEPAAELAEPAPAHQPEAVPVEEDAVTAAASPGPEASSPPCPEEPCTSVEAVQRPASRDESPAPSGEKQSATSPEGDGTVSEAQLDEDTRQKLKVLRRLTGGRVSDKELLARISREREGAAMGGGGAGKGKRRWWSG